MHIFENSKTFLQTDINKNYGHKYLDITEDLDIEDKFDLVLCTNVLEHVYETKIEAIKNLKSLMKITWSIISFSTIYIPTS